MGPSLGWDPGRRFPASCGPLVDVRRRAGSPSTSGWPPTLTSAVRVLSAKMAGALAVLHEGTWPSGVCRWAPGSVIAWRASGLPHVGTWFFQSVHSGSCGVSGRQRRRFSMWGPGAANRGLSGTLVRWYEWRVSGSQVAGVHRLLSLQGTSRGGEGRETRSPALATRDPGPSSSFDSGSRGVDVRRASGPRDGGALGLRRFVCFRLR